MSGKSVIVPVPKYDREQYLPFHETYSEDERRRIRQQYGAVRAFFRFRAAQFGKLQLWLNQAHLGTNFDVYLARATTYAGLAGIAGVVLGAVVAVQLAAAGVFDLLHSPVPVPTGIATFADTNRMLLAGGALTALIGGTFATSVFLWALYYPKWIVDRRRRNITLLLPHAIVYMFALSYGGMKPLQVFRETAKADDAFGDVATELGIAVRDVDFFGNDLMTAVQNLRNVTPNDNLEQFLDDLLSVLDSGSNFQAFLEEESRTYREEAQEEQDNFLRTLSILSEVFIVAFVAAPLFVIVTLILISLLGGESLPATYAVIYLVLPLGMAGYLLLVDAVSKPFDTVSRIDPADGATTIPPSDGLRGTATFRRYRFRRRLFLIESLLGNPVRTLRRSNPLVSLVLTGPIAVGTVVLLLVLEDTFGIVQTGSPIQGTIGFVVFPFLIVSIPLAVLYELRRWRANRIANQFPDTLNLLASANQMGIQLMTALNLVGRWSDGILEDELKRVRNDIAWNDDFKGALVAMGERLGIPQVARTMKLIATGSHASTDLSKILSIAAEDTRNRHKLERTRRQEMYAYVAILAIGFFVYLGVVVMLDATYVTPISKLSDTSAALGDGALLNVAAVSADVYRALFFHSALIQGVGSGLLAGKLTDNDLLSGLKFSIVLVLITLVSFSLL